MFTLCRQRREEGGGGRTKTWRLRYEDGALRALVQVNATTHQEEEGTGQNSRGKKSTLEV